MKKYNVGELYKNSKDNAVPLLSSFNASFWQHYLTNYDRFDNMFARMYYSFVYFNRLLDDDVDVDDARVQFSDDVYNILLKNEKRYEELFRIHVIEDNDSYSITNNYNKFENYSGNNNNQSSVITGQRTDVSINNVGEHSVADLNKVTGWNSNVENTRDSSNNVIGSVNENRQFTKGQEQDTSRSAEQESHVLRAYGNVGVSADEVIKKHYNFWMLFNFYQIVFDDINNELLMIGGDDYDC